jgi:glycosyltransferase involved in cell wall biosynthesis
VRPEKTEKFDSVLILGPSEKSRGGVRNYVDILLASPLHEEFDLQVFPLGSEGSEEGIVKAIWRSVRTPMRLFFTILNEKPGIVHLNPSFNKAFWRDSINVLICKLFRVPTLVQFHGGRPLELFIRWKPLNPLMRWLLCSSDRILVLSKEQQQEFFMCVPGKNIQLIPIMIDSQAYCASKKSEKSEDFRVLFLSRLVRQKGIYDLVEAIPDVLQQAPNAEFHIAGVGPESEHLGRLIALSGLEKKVKLHGFVIGKEKISLLAASHLFVFPTYYPEGFPAVILEAMAAGLPIITCSSGAIKDLIEEGVNGFLIPPKSPDVLANTIAQFCNNPEFSFQMGLRNRQKVEDLYDVRVISRTVSSIYRQLLRSENGCQV